MITLVDRLAQAYPDHPANADPWGEAPAIVVLVVVGVWALLAAWRKCSPYERRSMLGAFLLCGFLIAAHSAFAWWLGGLAGAIYACVMAVLVLLMLAAIMGGLLVVCRWGKDNG